MDDLVAFLRARLGEDEQWARAAGNRRWLVQDNIIELHPEREDDGFMSWPTRADARHAANWDPARVLRDVKAKRRILDEYKAAFDRTRRHPGDVATSADFLAMMRMAKLLALPYSDHRLYREEWKP